MAISLDLADAVETGEGFGDLRADGRDLDDAAAATRPVKIMYMTKSPSVISPARIDDPPTRIRMTPMTPTTSVENAVTAETPVIDCATLRNSRCAPRAKTSSSRFSAV